MADRSKIPVSRIDGLDEKLKEVSDAELQNKVNKAGDTMTGTLKISGNNEVRFGTDDNYYYLKHNNAGNFDFNIIKDGKIYGVFLDKQDNYALHYRKDQEFYRLLTTADLTNIDYVVERYRTPDGNNWYEVWKSGKVRQGGLVTVSGTVGATVTLLKPFANTAYNIQLTLQTTNAVGYLAATAQSVSIANSKTTTSFGVQTAGIQNYEINGISWSAEGQGA